MFNELIEWPIVSDRLEWQGRHVVKDVRGEAHLLFRLTLTGTHFPERSSEPFIRVGPLRSRFVVIAPGGLSASGYFDQPPPSAGVVEFGYAQTVFVRCGRGFDVHGVRRLQRALLPPDVRNVERFSALLD